VTRPAPGAVVVLGVTAGVVGVAEALGEGAGSLGLGDVVADGLVVGVGSPDAVAVGLGDAEADAVGPASAVGLVVGLGVGSANALVAGAPTSAAATSRVPARRNRAPRAVVGVDIGASLSGSRLMPEPPGAPVTRAPSRIPRRCYGAARTCRAFRLAAT
jgi:hypothetical protein